MRKMKILFDSLAPVEPQESAATQTEPRITLNEITLLSKMQAITHYNLGVSSIRRGARDCGALVRIGKRVVYHRQTLTESSGKQSCSPIFPPIS